MITQDCKPENYSIYQWRRVQVQKYIDEKPNAKGKEVLTWIRAQKTNPWLQANVRGLNQQIKRLRSSARNVVKENPSMRDTDSEPQPEEADDGDANPQSDIDKHDNLNIQKRLSRVKKNIFGNVQKWSQIR